MLLPAMETQGGKAAKKYQNILRIMWANEILHDDRASSCRTWLNFLGGMTSSG